VLINGESGTGKELVARALHRHSPRRDAPFIAINTAAIPRELLESELFGHERGAFTGAQQRREGRFEQANGGVLFLDEIGDMPMELQTRLLRVLADGQFYRVGGHTPIKVDVRIIAATHQDLERRVRENLFREDLLHRLNVVRIHVPALRDRREDIPMLAAHFLNEAAQELDSEVKSLAPDAERFICQLDWDGNVRQLENVCRWLTAMSPGQVIHRQDLPSELCQNAGPAGEGGSWKSLFRQWVAKRIADGDTGILKTVLPEIERILIEAALAHTAGRRQEAAHLLGWGRNTLTRKLKGLSIGDEDEAGVSGRSL